MQHLNLCQSDSTAPDTQRLLQLAISPIFQLLACPIKTLPGLILFVIFILSGFTKRQARSLVSSDRDAKGKSPPYERHMYLYLRHKKSREY